MDVKDQCFSLSKVMGAEYALKHRDLTYDEVFSPTGFLPVIAKRAEKLSNICFDCDLGATYTDEPKSSTGCRVDFDNSVSETIRMICIADVICELITMSSVKGKTMLDELFYD